MISLNAQGLRDYTKRRKVFNFMKKHTSSKGIIFMQETHSLKICENTWTNQFGCGNKHIVFSHGASDSRGVLIAFREASIYKVVNQYVDDSGRFIVLNTLIEDSPVVLINYYAPNEEKDQLKVLDDLNHILDNIDISEDTVLVWGGDFNLIFDIGLDADGGSPKLKLKSICKVSSIMSENDLCDIYRIRNPETKRFTWRRKTPFKQRRLDYFLISDCLQEAVQTIEIIPSVQSDHSALRLNVQNEARGRGYWKFNNSLIQDKEFVEAMKNAIPNFLKSASSFDDPILKWEFVKYKCRDLSRQISIEKSRERKSRRVKLENRLAELENIITTNSREEVITAYNNCKSDLEALYNYITEGIIMRSKSNWYEFGEKSSKYFLNLEKRNKAKSHVRTIIAENNSEINEPQAILLRIKDFYSTLYKRRSTKGEEECLEYLKALKIPKLSDVERESCEGLLTKKECWDALQRMKNDKNPGSDGLTKEFYVCFFNEVSNTLITALNHSFTTGLLSTSQRQAVITLIEKKGKDKRFMKNWRPISLINVDTKIASKALAARMENVLTSIVHCNQTAYVKDRYIGESIRLITDLLAYTEQNSIGGILFSADFEKAFDSVEHSFIFATLKSFGFGAQFIQWIRTIFNSTESCVINNCHSTGFSHWKGERVKVTLCQHFFSSCASRHCLYKFVTMKV